MNGTFWRGTAVSAALLLALVGLGRHVSAVARLGLPEGATRALRALRTGGPSREARDAQVAGYYEGLLDEGSRPTGVQSLLLGRLEELAHRDDEFKWEGVTSTKGDRYRKAGFLVYEQKPNVDVPDGPGYRTRHATNSMGLVDREYAVEKPPRTWRVALLGDSVTVGFGTRAGSNYEALLETALNRDYRTAEVDRFEIINFSVGGYRLTQLVDVAEEKAARFDPDVYVVALTEQINSLRWGAHVAQLYHDGVDLKYDFIRRLVAEANLAPTDTTTVMVSKLSRFRLEMVRSALQEVKAVADRGGATLVVLLIPTVRDRMVLEDSFAGTRGLLEDLGIPCADLLDAFDAVDDLDTCRAKPGDLHPNERGHRLIYESLRAKIAADRSLAAALLPRTEGS